MKSEREAFDEVYALMARIDDKQRQDELRELAKELYPFIMEMMTKDRMVRG